MSKYPSGKMVVSGVLVGSLLWVTNHEMTHSSAGDDIQLPPVGVSLIANSSVSTMSGPILVNYDAIREGEYSAPADQQQLRLSGVTVRSTST